MFDNGGYPPGAKYVSLAPYNEHKEPEKAFDVVCSQTLSKSFKIITDDYRHCKEENEDGIEVWDDTSDTNWAQEFYENDHHDPLALIKLFKEFLEEQLKQGIVFKSPAYTQHLIRECRDWEEDELTFCEDK